MRDGIIGTRSQIPRHRHRLARSHVLGFKHRGRGPGHQETLAGHQTGISSRPRQSRRAGSIVHLVRDGNSSDGEQLGGNDPVIVNRCHRCVVVGGTSAAQGVGHRDGLSGSDRGRIVNRQKRNRHGARIRREDTADSSHRHRSRYPAIVHLGLGQGRSTYRQLDRPRKINRDARNHRVRHRWENR